MDYMSPEEVEGAGGLAPIEQEFMDPKEVEAAGGLLPVEGIKPPVGLTRHVASKFISGAGLVAGAGIQGGMRMMQDFGSGPAERPPGLGPVLGAAYDKYGPKPIEETRGYKLGAGLRARTKDIFGTNPELEDSFLASDVPEALGSTASFAGIGLAGGGGVGAALAGSLVGRQLQREEAEQAGADKSTADLAETLGGVTGLSEGLPVEMMFGRLNKLTGGKLADRLIKAGASGAAEFLQEYSQSVAGNAIAKHLYDSNREYFDRSFREGAAGGVSGFLVDFVGNALGVRFRGKKDVAKITDADFQIEAPADTAPLDLNVEAPLPTTSEGVAAELEQVGQAWERWGLDRSRIMEPLPNPNPILETIQARYRELLNLGSATRTMEDVWNEGMGQGQVQPDQVFDPAQAPSPEVTAPTPVAPERQVPTGPSEGPIAPSGATGIPTITPNVVPAQGPSLTQQMPSRASRAWLGFQPSVGPTVAPAIVPEQTGERQSRLVQLLNVLRGRTQGGIGDGQEIQSQEGQEAAGVSASVPVGLGREEGQQEEIRQDPRLNREYKTRLSAGRDTAALRKQFPGTQFRVARVGGTYQIRSSVTPIRLGERARTEPVVEPTKQVQLETQWTSQEETSARDSKRMSTAILAQAAEDVQKGGEDSKSAREWLADTESVEPGSFQWVAETLDMDPDAVRGAIESGKADPEAMRDTIKFYTFIGPMAVGWDSMGGKFSVMWDKQPRLEISDKGAKLLPEFEKVGTYPVRLDSVFQHEALFKRYPWMREVPIKRVSPLFDFFDAYQGWYDDKKGELVVTPYAQNPHKTVLHELQHLIQEEEGWARGANPDMPLAKAAPEALRQTYIPKLREEAVEAEKKARENGIAAMELETALKELTPEQVEEYNTLTQAYEMYEDRHTKHGLDPARGAPAASQLWRDWYAEHSRLTDLKMDTVDERMKLLGYVDPRNSRIDLAGYFKLTVEETQKKLVDKIDRHMAAARKAEAAIDIIDKGNPEEVNELIQDKYSYELYQHTAGEFESRDTAARAELGKKQRKEVPPYSSEDISVDRLITLYSFDPFTAMKMLSHDLWHSKMIKVIDSDKVPPLVTKDEFLTRIDGMLKKGEFKKEEWEDTVRLTGFKQWLEKWGNQPIPKSAIMEELRQNGIRVEENVYRNVGFPLEAEGLANKLRNNTISDAEYEEFRRITKEYQTAPRPKYNSREGSLPGARNHIELVLWSPSAEELGEDPNHFQEGTGRRAIGFIMGGEFTEANGETVFVIDTVQSPRHQSGASKGYKLIEDERVDRVRKLSKEFAQLSKEQRELGNKLLDNYDTLGEEEKDIITKRLNQIKNNLHDNQVTYEELVANAGIPDAPFRKSHITLLLRRAIRWAAERGIRKIAWTTGEQQANRWWGEDESKYSSWPQKIYGFEGEYHNKSLIGIGMKEAMKPWGKAEEGFVTKDKVLSPEIKKELDAIIKARDDAYANFMAKMEDQSEEESFRLGLETNKWDERLFSFVEENNITMPSIFVSGLKAYGNPSKTEFSIQPSITLSNEQVRHYTSTPMYLYSFDFGFMLNKAFGEYQKLPGGNMFTRLGSAYNAYGRPPRWLSKVKENYGKIYRRDSQITMESTEKLQNSLSSLDSVYDLNGAQQKTAFDIILQIDGRKLAATPTPEISFKPDNTGKEQAVVNPQHYTEYAKWLEGKGVDEKTRAWLVGVKKSSNQDFMEYFNSLSRSEHTDQSVLEDLKQNVGLVPNHFPHNWYGDKYIEGKDKDGKVKARLPIQSKLYERLLGGTNRVGKIIEAVQNMPQYKGLTWDKEVKSADELERYYINGPIPIDVIGRVLDEAAKRLETTHPEAAEKFRAALPKEVMHIIKTKGFGNFAKRKGMLGYETEDIVRSLADYKIGLYGTLRRMQQAKEFSQMLMELKPGKQELHDIGSYIEDRMAPRGRLDTLVEQAKEFFFMKHLAGRIKPAVVNMTNLPVTAVPNLGLHAGPRSVSEHMKASKDITAQFAKESTEKMKRIGINGMFDPQKNHLSVEEVDFLKQGQVDGTTQPQQVRDMMDRLRRGYKKRSQFMGKTISFARHLGGLPMELTEWYSRSSTYLAAGRAMAEGKVTYQKTLDQYGLQKGEKIPLSDPRVKEFAREVTLDSYGEYGAQNRPAIVRSKRLGKILSVGYTFRHFTHNLGELWMSFLKQGPRGWGAAGASWAGQVLFGGLLRGLPLASVLAAMYKRWWPEDDPEEKLRSVLPGDDDMKDALLYGIGAHGFGGAVPKVSIGGSIEFTLPDSVTALIAGSVGDLGREDFTTEAVGVAAGTVKDAVGGFNAWANGDKRRALEYMMPLVVLRDILTANRLHEQGQYTITGRPVVLPPKAGEEFGPTKLTEGEARLRALGFQSLKMDKSYRLSERLEGMDNYRKNAQSKLASRFANALKDGNQDEMLKVGDEIIAWDIMWAAKGRPEYMIDPNAAIRSRVRPDLGPERMRPEAGRLREAYGF